MNNDWKPTENNIPNIFQPTPQTPEQVENGLRNAFRQAIKDGVMDATPYLKQMTFNSDIEKTEGEIKVLQAKLELLKEMDKHKSPAEEAYKRWWGDYPSTNESVSETEDMRWSGFQAGYEAAQKDYKVGEYQQPPQKPTTLYDVIYEWCDEIFIHNSQSGQNVESLVEQIEEYWLPKPQQEAGDTEVYYKNKGWNNCLKKIKGMLR